MSSSLHAHRSWPAASDWSSIAVPVLSSPTAASTDGDPPVDRGRDRGGGEGGLWRPRGRSPRWRSRRRRRRSWRRRRRWWRVCSSRLRGLERLLRARDLARGLAVAAGDLEPRRGEVLLGRGDGRLVLVERLRRARRPSCRPRTASFAAVTAWRACLSLRLFWATVVEYEDRAFDSWRLAEVTWSFAWPATSAVPPARSVFRCAFAAARFASARRTASSAVASSATARTSPALTRSPTVTLTAVTGHVTVTERPPPESEEAEVDEEAAVAVAARGRGRSRSTCRSWRPGSRRTRGRRRSPRQAAAGGGRLLDGGRGGLRGAVGDRGAGLPTDPEDGDRDGADADGQQPDGRDGLEVHVARSPGWARTRRRERAGRAGAMAVLPPPDAARGVPFGRITCDGRWRDASRAPRQGRWSVLGFSQRLTPPSTAYRSISASSSGVKSSLARSPRFSRTCSGELAPMSVVVTRGSRSTHA